MGSKSVGGTIDPLFPTFPETREDEPKAPTHPQPHHVGGPRANRTKASSAHGTAPQDSVGAYDAKAERTYATRELSPFEAAIDEKVRSMKPGDSMDFTWSSKTSVGVHGEATARLRVDRQEDGTFKVRISGAAGGGEGYLQLESLALTGEVSRTLRFQTHEGVADFLQAVGQRGAIEASSAVLLGHPLAQVPLNLARSLDSGGKRVAHHLTSATEAVGGGVGFRGEAGSPKAHEGVDAFDLVSTLHKAGAEVEGGVTVDCNLRSHEVTLEVKLKGEAAAALRTPVFASVKLAGKLEGEVKARARVKLTDAEVAQLESGKTTVNALLGRLAKRAEYTAVVEARGTIESRTPHAGDVISAKVEAEFPLAQALAAHMDPIASQALVSEAEWSGSVYRAAPGETFGGEVSAGVVSGGLSARLVRLQSRTHGTLGEVARSIWACGSALVEGRSDPGACEVEAHAAVANLSK